MMDDEKANDQYREHTITQVSARPSGKSWSMSFAAGSMSLAREDFDPDVPRDLEPQVGDLLRLYGVDQIRGVDLNGRQLYYRTRQQSEMQRRLTTIDHHGELRERFASGREKLDAEVAALSAPLQARIERLRAQDSDFRWKEEAQMLVIYVAADRIADWICREHGWTPGDVGEQEALRAMEAFRNLSIDEQEARVPRVYDDQSAGSWRETCDVALALLSGRRV